MQTVIIIIILYVTFNLNVFHLPPYERELLHYKLANSDCIQRTIKNFYWVKAFINVDVNKKYYFLMKLLLNIIRNFILYEIITHDDMDLPWMIRLIKKAINDKNVFYLRFVNFTNNDSNSERLR